MEKVKKIIADHPVTTSALVTVAIVWAYHNGHLNSIFATPGKMVLIEEHTKTQTALTKSEV